MQHLNSILLIDDNQFNNYLNRNIIRDLQIAKEIHIVHDGLEALKTIQDMAERNNLPDVILLDLVMPKLDGIEFMDVFEKIHFTEKKPKVIVLTAIEHEKEVRKIQNYKIDGIIYKPLTEEKLLNA